MKHKTEAATDLTPDGRLLAGDLGALLGYQLAQAAVTTNQVFNAVTGQGSGLRQVEFTVLALIAANPDLTASALAKALAVTPPNITMWLDRLDSAGHIQRVRSTADRRAQHLRVSARGAKLVARLSLDIQAAEREALAGLSLAERALLLELLQKVARGRGKSASKPRAAAGSASKPAAALAPVPTAALGRRA